MLPSEVGSPNGTTCGDAAEFHISAVSRCSIRVVSCTFRHHSLPYRCLTQGVRYFLQSCIKIWDLESKSIVEELRYGLHIAQTRQSHTIMWSSFYQFLLVCHITYTISLCSGRNSRPSQRRPR